MSRYSGEQTVFRELLQNADDASATQVEIHFRTAQGGPTVLHPTEDLPNLKTKNIASITVRNDGIVFREEDWGRLKKVRNLLLFTPPKIFEYGILTFLLDRSQKVIQTRVKLEPSVSVSPIYTAGLWFMLRILECRLLLLILPL